MRGPHYEEIFLYFFNKKNKWLDKKSNYTYKNSFEHWLINIELKMSMDFIEILDPYPGV